MEYRDRNNVAACPGCGDSIALDDELAQHRWNDGSMYCVVCGMRIPAMLVAYAIKNGATMSERPR